MTEVWLRPNRRILLMALVPAASLALAGLLLIRTAEAVTLQAIGGCALALGAALVVGLVDQLRRPRIAFREGQVLFNLRAGAPVETPVEVVEAFFLGQGPANLPAMGDQRAETVNLVARLSQKWPEWNRIPVKPALGNWCEGYVTIRGTWCEPLDGELIRRLNHRLREVRDAAAKQVARDEA